MRDKLNQIITSLRQIETAESLLRRSRRAREPGRQIEMPKQSPGAEVIPIEVVRQQRQRRTQEEPG